MKQSITYLKQGLAFSFWLTVALLSGLSGYVSYTPEPLRATYRTEIVFTQKQAAEQVQVSQPSVLGSSEPQAFGSLAIQWYQHQQEVAFQQTTQSFYSIKAQLQRQLLPVTIRYANEPSFFSSIG